MLDLTPFAIHTLSVLSGAEKLHRLALRALHDCRWHEAEVLFEAAARRCRRDLDVERLARVRVHQLMAQVLSGTWPGRDAEHCIEVEQRLTQLDYIESLKPPFALVEARTLLANWLGDVPSQEDEPESESFEHLRAA